MLLIKDIMSPNPLTVDTLESAREAKRIMLDHTIRHLPVMENGKLVGIITDRDLKLAQAVAEDDQFDIHRTVGEICVRNVYFVEPTEQAQKVLAYISKERIGSALIVEDGELVGIFTVVDACKAFAYYLEKHDT